MRRSLIVTSISSILVFFGCAVTSTGSSVPPPKPPAGRVVFRLAETHPRDYPTTRGDLEFAHLVEERTGGRIRIEVFDSSKLGEEREVIEQVQFGAIDFTRVSISPLAAFAGNFDVLQLPYLYRDSEHMWAVLNGEIGDEFLASLEAANFVGLCWYDSGSRNFYNSRRPIRTPEDLRGLRLRVQQSRLMVDMVGALGAVAIPMAFGEVYSALQTNLIDGAENNVPSYVSQRHYEVARFFTRDEHTRVPEVTIGSRIVLSKLSAADQETIRRSAKDSMALQRSEWKIFEAVAERRAREAGCEFTEIDKTSFFAAMRPVYEKLPPALTDVVERIQRTGLTDKGARK